MRGPKGARVVAVGVFRGVDTPRGGLLSGNVHLEDCGAVQGLTHLDGLEAVHNKVYALPQEVVK